MTGHPQLRVFPLINRLCLVLAFACALVLPGPARADAAVLYAAPTAQGAGDCSSWADACTLQAALAAAAASDEIWVRSGVHYPTSDPNGWSVMFSLRSGVKVYGGFAGVETSREQRDWVLNQTILSGDIDHDDVNTDGNSIAETTSDIQGVNSRHLVYGSALDMDTVLDGFIITAGKDASGAGAGIYLDNGSRPTLSNLLVIGNYASSGGGLMIVGSGPTLLNVSFINNVAEYRGGGIRDSSNINTTIINAQFIGNVSGNHGAALETNYSRSSGGVLTLVNVLFRNNDTPYAVAGIFSDSSNLSLTNVTFAGNTSAGNPSVMYAYQSIMSLSNVIIWGNGSPEQPEFLRDSSYYSPITIRASNIRGCGVSSVSWNDNCGNDGGSNIDADPQYVDASIGNMRLGAASPCVDAGSNFLVPAGISTDLDGNARFVDMPLAADTGIGSAPIVDMGAYERYEDDTAPEVASITRQDPSPTRAGTVRFLVAFSEPVLGIAAEDFSVTAPALSGAAIQNVSGGPRLYTVLVGTGSGSGDLRLDVPATAAAADYMGNSLAALPYESGEQYTLDRDAPVVNAVTRAGANPTNAASVAYRVTFSEPVTGVAAADFDLTSDEAISGAAIAGVVGAGSVYTVSVNTGTGDGVLGVNVAETAEIADLAGNPLTELPFNTGEVYTIDKTAPLVESILRLDSSPIEAASVAYAVTFSEDVTGTQTSAFSVTSLAGNSGASVLDVAGAGAQYTVTVSSGVGGGRVRLDIPLAAPITDLAGNPLANLPYTDGETYIILYHHVFVPLSLK